MTKNNPERMLQEFEQVIWFKVLLTSNIKKFDHTQEFKIQFTCNFLWYLILICLSTRDLTNLQT